MKMLHGAAVQPVFGGQESDQKRLFLPLALQDDDRSTQMKRLEDKRKCIDAMEAT